MTGQRIQRLVHDFRKNFWLNLGHHEGLRALKDDFERLSQQGADDVKELVFSLGASPKGKKGRDQLPLAVVNCVQMQQGRVILETPWRVN